MLSQSRGAVRRRPSARAPLLVCLGVVLAACGSTTPSPSASAPGLASPSASAGPTATALPTPAPTPSYTNPPDAALAGIIPRQIRGETVHVPGHSQFAYTPGDMVPAYGDLALRFTALQVAFVEDPRLSLYVARVAGELPTTRQLAPYLATAGEYVGIAGLHRKEWKYRTIAGRVAWVRPEDNATAAGTMIYTWTGEEYVFLLIGTDDRLNRALFAELPGEKAKVVEPSTPASAEPSAEATAGS
ncbi:MAG TPA: hypothetical protein VIA82_10435 [Candidatus Limnocylindria bacterium]|jgi:hypothetical protein